MLEKLYFQGNLKGLVNELSKYQSEEQSLDLIYDIDKAHRELNSETKQQLLFVPISFHVFFGGSNDPSQLKVYFFV